MSRDHDDRAKLARLADALIQNIITTSDADILADIDQASIERARTILIEVKANLSSRLFADANAQLQTWRSEQSGRVYALDRAAARDRFEKILRADPALDQRISIAARNGKAPTDNDKEGLSEDWADLQKLEDEDKLE